MNTGDLRSINRWKRRLPRWHCQLRWARQLQYLYWSAARQQNGSCNPFLDSSSWTVRQLCSVAIDLYYYYSHQLFPIQEIWKTSLIPYLIKTHLIMRIFKVTFAIDGCLKRMASLTVPQENRLASLYLCRLVKPRTFVSRGEAPSSFCSWLGR